MRVLTISLTNGKQTLSIGGNDEITNYNYDVTVNGSKFMSALKDNCVVTVSNLSYDVIVRIIKTKQYSIEVKCGYKDSSLITIFKGEVLYISDVLEADRTHTAVIICASSLLAKYGQSRMNITLNSNINLYTAIKYISRRSGINSEDISKRLKLNILQDSKTGNETAASWLNRLMNENEYLAINTDGTKNSVFSIFDTRQGPKRIIKLNRSFINLDGGYPKLTKDGLSLSIMPTFDFMCGDVIQIDNSLIDISARATNEVKENRGYYIDKEGYYMIFEIAYTLENHGNTFSVSLNCKSYSRISNYIND